MYIGVSCDSGDFAKDSWFLNLPISRNLPWFKDSLGEADLGDVQGRRIGVKVFIWLVPLKILHLQTLKRFDCVIEVSCVQHEHAFELYPCTRITPVQVTFDICKLLHFDIHLFFCAYRIDVSSSSMFIYLFGSSVFYTKR